MFDWWGVTLMMKVVAVLLGVIASSAAFAPPATSVRTSTAVYGYVPAGLSEAEYKARVAADKKKVIENKTRFPKGKPFKGVKEWLLEMQGKQQFTAAGKFKNSGHTYAKQKYETKEEYDAAKKK